MSKAAFFNKGLLKGKLIKSELVSWEKDGKKGDFLSLEVDTGNSNKVKATLFPTKSNPNKHKEIFEAYPIGAMVEVSGNVNEREYEANGKRGVDRSLSAFTVKSLDDEKEPNATFIIQGIVESVKETNEGVSIKVRLDESYEKDGKTVEKDPLYFTLQGDVSDQLDELDVVKGCNAKFKGRIYNKLEFDDYGDITGNVQMFQIDKIENVIQPDDLEEEELPFI